ncbi:MAG: iron uptake system protein EfeO [Propionibacteriaceae bacterium]
MKRPLAIGLAAIATLSFSGCTDNAPKDGNGTLTVTASDTACDVSAEKAPSGTLTFTVKNTGSKVNEFYLLASDGLRILGEVENIGPGLSRDLVLVAPAGKYFTACKPGMIGDGIRKEFTITESGADIKPKGDDAALVAEADRMYGAYIKDQTEQLLTKTEEFAKLFLERKDTEAKALYPVARQHWERVETVAESFGDLDPMMDAREADLAEGDKWTGWHVAEKDLWAPAGYTAMTDEQRKEIADKLVADTKTLYDRTRDLTYALDTIANGAKGLLDEVATGKVTGEEEAWSHTDLYDFQANIDGAHVAWEGVRPILQRKNADLDKEIASRFEALQKLLDAQREGNGFKTYDKLTADEVKAFSDAVNALGEPLSKLTVAILS